MLSAALGFLSAFVFGSADFLGGLAAKRLRSVTVTAIAAVMSLAVLLMAYPLLGGQWNIRMSPGVPCPGCSGSSRSSPFAMHPWLSAR